MDIWDNGKTSTLSKQQFCKQGNTLIEPIITLFILELHPSVRLCGSLGKARDLVQEIDALEQALLLAETLRQQCHYPSTVRTTIPGPEMLAVLLHHSPHLH